VVTTANAAKPQSTDNRQRAKGAILAVAISTVTW
jgi:hypothetical protein